MEKKIEELKNNLKILCSKQTCYPLQQNDWTKDNPFLGHCAVVALIVYKKFGGKIMRGKIMGTNVSHYWNEIKGTYYDLTQEQFKNHTKIINAEYASPEVIVSNQDTHDRFEILLKKLEQLKEREC